MTFDDVERLATSLPDVVEGTSYGRRCWKVGGKAFATHRPLGKKDLAALGDAAPAEDPLLVSVEHLVATDALVATEDACFTTPHFDGYPAVLVRLDVVSPELLDELITDSWLTAAPKATAADFLAAEEG
jgi:hypothetical protein